MKFSKIVFLFCLALMSLDSAAQSALDTHQKILQTLERREYLPAIVELENLRKADRTIFEINNYDYLLARAAEKQGDTAKAAAHYQTVVNRNSVLKEYALWHLAAIARASGNLLLERTYLQEILAVTAESLLTDAARNRLARSYFEGKNYDSAIRQLSLAGGQSREKTTNNEQRTNENAPSRENLVMLGEAYLQSGKTNEAKEIFARLVNNPPNPAQPDDYALAGARGLDRLEAGAEFGKTAPPLSDYEHLRRARIYQFNRDFPAARLHFQAIVQNHPASGITPDAIYQIGRAFAQEANFVEAINWFERVLEQFPEHAVARDALTQAASAYARVGKPKEAIARYQKFIEKYPDAENLERAYLNIIDVERDAGANADALKQAQKTQEVFRGKLPEALALFAQLRIHMAQEEWQNSLAAAEKLLTFADLGGTRVPGGTNKTEINFLKALALENLQRFAEAIDVYLSIPDGRAEYYGWRATERLRLLTNNEKAKPALEQKIAALEKQIGNAETARRAAQDLYRLNVYLENREKLLDAIKKIYAASPEYQKIPNFKLLEFGRREILRSKSELSENHHQNLADELLFLGLYDEATPELERARQPSTGGETNPKSEIRNQKSPDFAYTLAVFYKRGDMAHRAAAFIEPLWRNVPADFQIELIPREQAELLYPAPYADALLRYAPERNVDPRYVLSIMRQESRFRADVKSNAAARGLMQFISTTADQIARELKKDDFRQDELYHPPTAVLFGSQYLANIFRQFPAQPAAVAASYNGGEDNVRRWLLRAKSELPDRYVAEIVFSQSKDYAYKVMANYRVYQIFYDENLRAR